MMAFMRRPIDGFRGKPLALTEGESIIEEILRVFLRRQNEDNSPAYINEGAMWFYLPDGKLSSLPLSR